MSDLTNLLNYLDKSGRGVCVQASTLGSLEALLEFLKVSKIPVSGINIGPVHKKDIMRSATMLEKAKELACILCFDVPVDRDAEKLAEEMGIRLFKGEVVCTSGACIPASLMIFGLQPTSSITYSIRSLPTTTRSSKQNVEMQHLRPSGLVDSRSLPALPSAILSSLVWISSMAPSVLGHPYVWSRPMLLRGRRRSSILERCKFDADV